MTHKTEGPRCNAVAGLGTRLASRLDGSDNNKSFHHRQQYRIRVDTSVSAESIAAGLGGRWTGNGWMARCPAHKDRKPSLKIDEAEDGMALVYCYAGCDQARLIDCLRAKGLWHEPKIHWRLPTPVRVHAKPTGDDNRALAQSLWNRRKPISGTPAETYLRVARNCHAVFPETLGFLPAHGRYHAAMIAAFGLAQETEPGHIEIAPHAVHAVHLTAILPDGSGKIDTPDCKKIIGRGAAGIPIVIAPPNDLLGLAITEGIEDGLSVFESTGLGVWIAGSAGRMSALADSIRTCIEQVTVFGHDDGGRRCAEELVRRLLAKHVHAELKILRCSHGAAQ